MECPDITTYLGTFSDQRQTAPVAGKYDVIAIGRVGIDLYPLQAGKGLEDVNRFAKFLGGSAANVTVAAARLGRSAALVSRVGEDPFGGFIAQELERFGVSSEFILPVPESQTPITFCEVFPPDDFPLYFYSQSAPYFEIRSDELDLAAVAQSSVFWATLTGLSKEPSRSAHYVAWDARSADSHTVLDLDYRERFWVSREAARAEAERAITFATVVIGNREECEIATGEKDPKSAARALLDAGVKLAIVKQGPLGVLGMTADETVIVPPVRVNVINGLGAGDAFGGAIVHGLLNRWPLEQMLQFANAAGAIVASRLECSSAMPTENEVNDRLRDRILNRESISNRIAAVREMRADTPVMVRTKHQLRKQRGVLSDDGRLLLIAADHPARGALGVRDQRNAMASRNALLERVAIAISRPGVDGVLATADIIEDLLLMGLLDDKLVIGSMNRGGLQGAAFELDDRFTGYDVDTIVGNALDGGKMLCRIALDDPGTARTLEAVGRAVTDLNHAGLIAMVEPFMSARHGDRVINDLSTEAVIKSVAIASGLGATTAHSWLKLPVVERMDEVMAATTLPTLLLGGDPSSDPDATYATWADALLLPSVRGLVVGRALLYPSDGDVESAVDIAAQLVHGKGKV